MAMAPLTEKQLEYIIQDSINKSYKSVSDDFKKKVISGLLKPFEEWESKLLQEFEDQLKEKMSEIKSSIENSLLKILQNKILNISCKMSHCVEWQFNRDNIVFTIIKKEKNDD